MNLKRAVILAVIVVAVAALALPIIGNRARASATSPASSVKPGVMNSSPSTPVDPVAYSTNVVPQDIEGNFNKPLNPEAKKAFGVKRLPKGKSAKDVGAMIARKLTGDNVDAQARVPNSALPPLVNGAAPINPNPGSSQKAGGAPGGPLIGQPLVLNETAALSTALITSIGGRDNQFSEVGLLSDWDGREDCTADRGAKIDDFSGIEVDIDFSLTRAAISEVTFGNGHLLNLYYYGDTLGNLYFGADLVGSSLVDVVFQANITELVTTGASNGFVLLNRTANDCTDDQVTVTGIAVNPVADLADFGFCGLTGEIIYVSILDTEGCASNAANQPIRTRIFAFATFNIGATVFIVPQVREILRSRFSNTAGIAVDDDGNLYYQLVDLIQLSGGAIFKATEIPRTTVNNAPDGADADTLPDAVTLCGGTPSRVNRAINIIPDPPTLNSWRFSTGTTDLINVSNGVRNTNYGFGSSGTYGNIVSLTSGSCNVLFAAVSASFVPGAVSFEQLTQGLFSAPSAFASGTPSMVISFADCSGAFDSCTAPAPGAPGTAGTGTLPIANGIADAAQAGLTVTPGVNNFRIFVLGNGPDIRPVVGGTSVVPGTPASVLKVDMQVDYTLHSGVAVNEEGTLFVISGGTPAGIGKNPSPMLGEILCFEDMCPMDRRGDFVDLRGNLNPNPPASGGNVGDGDSDRFDHIYYQSPFDQVTFTPAGLSGLDMGFLRYTNRLAPIAISPNVTLGLSGGQQVLADDSSAGPIIFENLDPSHQVAGGDDQNVPNRGDDDDGAGSPSLGSAFLAGGFEFVFGATGVPNGTPACAPVVWNGFFLNSNGNITFGAGDGLGGSINSPPNVPGFRSGLPRIAPAWADLNTAARAVNLINFPTQALGFANVNAFRIRWLNVPEFGKEGCSTNVFGIGGNTFGITLYDDGTGLDENTNKGLELPDVTGDNVDTAYDLQEGPTDLRFVTEPNSGTLVGCNPRRNGSGHFFFDYCRTEMLGTPELPVLTGYSIGGTSGLNPPGLCETNLSEVARAADNNPFGVINGQTASIQACLIGEGTEPHIFEFFNDGRNAGAGSGGEIVFATPDFDLRFEGNDPALCTPIRQRDLNRGKVGFFGVGCPANPLCQLVTPVGTVTVAPNQPAVGSAAAGSQVNSSGVRQATATSGIINAVCNVQLNFLGCFFIPNEVTTICQGFSAETGVPLQRPGKTVTSALRLGCDTNGDGSFDSVTTLTGVNPLNINLVRGTISAPGQVGFTGTGFPLSCCGGLASLTLTTTFTEGDNNIFGAFALTSNCTIDLGVRAPVVVSITPSSGDCRLPLNDLLISGGCFILPGFGANGVGTTNVTSVFAIEQGNPGNVRQALRFVVLSPFLINADFAFTSADAGKTFLIFVSGPNGTSQNLTSLPAGTQGCPAGFLGNQLGIQVTFKCDSLPPPPGTGGPQDFDIALVNGCAIERTAAGGFTAVITGSNIQPGATITIGTTLITNKIKFKGVDGANAGRVTRVILKGQQLCSLLPGNIIIKNIGSSTKPGANSIVFRCERACATTN